MYISGRVQMNISAGDADVESTLSEKTLLFLSGIEKIIDNITMY